MKQKNYTNPVVKNRKGNLDKPWYIEFYYNHPDTYQPIRFQYKSAKSLGLKVPGKGNRASTKKERTEYFAEFNSKLINALSTGTLIPKLFPSKSIQDKDLSLAKTFEKVIQGKSDLAKDTLFNYKYTIKIFLSYIKEKRINNKVDQIGKSTVLEFLDQINGKVNYNAQLTNLRAIFNKAIEIELMETNPCNKIKKKKTTPKNHKRYTPELAKKIINYCKVHNPNLHIAILLQYYAFLRPAEIIKLERKYIDLINEKITITSHTGKTKVTRTIPIHNELKKELEKRKMETFVLGKRFNDDYLKTAWGRLKKKIDIPTGFTLYGFKHTGVCALYQATKDIYLVSKLCGHTSIKTTEIYLRSLGEEPNFLDNSKIPTL